MPPLEKKYDETPLQVLTDKATRARIRRLKDHGAAPSQAAVIREILAVGLPMMEEMHGLDRIDDGLGE